MIFGRARQGWSISSGLKTDLIIVFDGARQGKAGQGEAGLVNLEQTKTGQIIVLGGRRGEAGQGEAG